MIVKNESGVIVSTLERVVDFVDYWVVCDTGSTDNTCETVEIFFRDKGVPGEIFHDKWVNFAHNRTLAFQRARPRADYVWVLDADDLLCGSFSFPVPMTHDAYSLRYGAPHHLRFERPQIFTSKTEWEYRGVLHELPFRVDNKPYYAPTIPGDYYMDYMQSRIHTTNFRSKNPLKYLRDAQVMEKALATETTDAESYWRYVYYIAQSYFDYGAYDKACDYFTRYAKGVRNGDTCFAHLYAAFSLSQIDKVKHETRIIEHYLSGYVAESTRAECLYFLALLYFDSGRYDNAYTTLLLCKDMSTPASGFKVFASLYEFDMPWLWIRTCHILRKTKEEKDAWHALLSGHPQTVDKVDVRLYPLAVQVLTFQTPAVPPSPLLVSRGENVAAIVRPDADTMVSLLSSLTDPQCVVVVESEQEKENFRFILRTGGCRWLFVRRWSLGRILSDMKEKRVARMRLCFAETLLTLPGRPEEIGVWIEDTDPQKKEDTTWKDALCTRYPTASYETLFHPNENDVDTDVIIVSLGTSGVGPYDFLCLLFLFSLCHEFSFSFRFSTHAYKGAVPFQGSWNKKSALIEFLRQQPILSTGDFFRTEWLPVDYKTVAWPALLRFLGCVSSSPSSSAASTEVSEPASFLDLLGVREWILHDAEWTHRPLLAHLVALVDVRFTWRPPIPPTTLLPLGDMVAPEILFHCFSPVALVEGNGVVNEILRHSSCVVVDPATETDGTELRVGMDYALSEPFLTWQVRFMELVWNARQWKHPWTTMSLSESGDAFCLWRDKDASTGIAGAAVSYSLFYALPPTDSETTKECLFFPGLHFVDAEVYYTSALEIPRGVMPHYFDGYNNLGFYKKWREKPHFEMETMDGYAGEWIAAASFDRRFYDPRKGLKRWDRVLDLVPLIAVNSVHPVLVVGPGHVDPDRCPLDDYFFLGSTVRTDADKQRIMVHLHVWDALTADADHEYYVVMDHDAVFSKERGLLEDAQANLTTVLALLNASYPAWDVVVLGSRDNHHHDGQRSSSSFCVVEGYEGSRALGYMIHKKTACFLLTLLHHCGFHYVSLEQLWTSHRRWLCLFSLSDNLMVL